MEGPVERRLVLRKFLLYVHLYVGAIAAIFLFLLGLTGGVLVFEEQIDHWLNRNLVAVSASGSVLSLDELKTRLEAANPGSQVIGFELPQRDAVAYLAALKPAQGDLKELIVDPHDARVMGNVDQLSEVMAKVHGFHTHLSSLLGSASKPLLGWSSIGLFILAVSGTILWWPRKVFRWTMTANGKRLIFDLHNAIGFYSAIFLVMFSLTGAVIHWEQKANELANRVSPPQSPAVQMPKPAPNATMLGPSKLLNIAQSALPGARVTLIQFLPGRPSRAQMKFPEDHTPAGRSLVSIDAYNGQILQSSSSRNAPVAVKYVRMWNREIHTGDLWGWPTKLLAFFFSLMLCVMTVTGPILWWNRQGRQWLGRDKK